MSVKSDNALERIAEALEGVERRLSNMEQSLEILEELCECVSKSQYGAMLCVTGNITNYDGN